MSRTSTGVEFRALRRTFGPVVALDHLDLDIAPGELIALLGPSGCGKTTALRLLAGLDHPDSGSVLVAGRDVTHTPAAKRNMGMVFQSYSLFPNLTAMQNVAFGLRVRRVGRAERMRRADDLLELVGLSEQRNRYPHAMSGGQQQRVALARALAIEPDVLLLDEPLSALDAQVRGQLRDEIRRLQLELGITTLFVTHDQEEAMAIADRVGVMRAGRLEQLDAPSTLYAQPATPFVASFVGTNNAIRTAIDSDGRVAVLGASLGIAEGSDALAPGEPAMALLRPESVTVERIDGSPSGARATLATASFHGPTTRLTLRLADATELLADLPSTVARTFSPGDEVLLRPGVDRVVLQRHTATEAAHD